MKKKISLVFHLALALLLFGLISCKKENLGPLEDISKDISQFPSSITGEATATFVGLKVIQSVTNAAPYTQVQLKDVTSSPVKVKAVIDTTLFPYYEELYQVKPISFPKDAFKIRNDGILEIEAGKSISTDSLFVDLNNGNGLLPDEVYVIPLKFSVESGNGELKGKYAFLKMKVKAVYIVGRMDQFSTEKNFSKYYDRFAKYIMGGFFNTRMNGVDDASKNVSMSVKLMQSINVDVTAEAIEDRSLVSLDFFNKKRNAKSKLLPEGSYKIVKNKATIKANQWSSQDSIKVEIDYDKLEATIGNETYVLIMKIDNSSDKELLAPDTVEMANRAFIEINHKIIDTKNIISNDGLTGKDMDRSKWTATSSGNFDTETTASKVLDGKGDTYWRSPRVMPQDITINMGDSKLVKGFSFTPQYNDSYDDFREVKVYSSQDGQTWEFQGYFLAGSVYWDSSVEKPDIKTLRFINPVQAKYFKFQVMEASNGITAIAEINGKE
ncbi:BT_3987 domain-containing protein [Sphingobacterium sp. 1.A.5]|jgi:hypothetical protein|uniref:BT_3987 domain-containing protein n=1 Tax=Sphingobacterium sp. 1.A.5 TaxID=2044604 RepID=UPI000C0BE132|nr:DUF1735 domain-containing protein [Sphingobacterium sp. 1.A.5]